MRQQFTHQTACRLVPISMAPTHTQRHTTQTHVPTGSSFPTRHAGIDTNIFSCPSRPHPHRWVSRLQTYRKPVWTKTSSRFPPAASTRSLLTGTTTRASGKRSWRTEKPWVYNFIGQPFSRRRWASERFTAHTINYRGRKKNVARFPSLVLLRTLRRVGGWVDVYAVSG